MARPCGSSIPSPDVSGDDRHIENARRRATHFRCPGLSSEDLVQEAIAAALEAVAEYDPAEHASLDRFIAGRVRRRLLAVCRLARLQSAGRLVCPVIDPSPGPAELAERSDLWGMSACLLSPRQDLVLARTASGYSDREIAAELGVTGGAVRKARQRAICILRCEIQGD